MKLTPKQKAFCDYYIETGNASEAARKAGYSKKTAAFIGAENIRKPQISAYISERLAGIEAQRVASADEVIKFYSSVMRGEVKDQFGLDAALSDRLKAADSLMKRYAVAGVGPADTVQEDELSKSLRELAKGLESDD